MYFILTAPSTEAPTTPVSGKWLITVDYTSYCFLNEELLGDNYALLLIMQILTRFMFPHINDKRSQAH